MRRILLLLALFLLSTTTRAAEPPIELEVVVAAPVHDVWNAWTTREGVKTFFANGANIDPRPDGDYEIFFDPSKPAGHRGADGMRILVFEPDSRFAFTWNAPEKFPHARKQRTHVTVTLTPVDAAHTRVQLTHDGFGTDAEWREVREYFTHAWGDYVLPRLKASFEKGKG
jgi:uncharacterized protein YndB with AHSA1/START domain